MNTGKTHAIVVKTRTLKTRYLAMLVAVVVLGGVGVDGGWGDSPDASNSSWKENGDAISGSSGEYAGCKIFGRNNPTSDSQGNDNSHGASAETNQPQPDTQRENLTNPSSNPDNSKCTSDSVCKHAQPCPNNSPQVCLNNTCSCPGDDGTSRADLSPSLHSETQSSDLKLRQCPNGDCGSTPDRDSPPPPPACTGSALRCCPGQEDSPPPYCATALFNCKCPN